MLLPHCICAEFAGTLKSPLFRQYGAIMQTLYNEPAENYSTFRLKNTLSKVMLVEHSDELAAFANEQPLILGEGSNTIFLASQQRPILRYIAKQKYITSETDQHIQLHVEAGHNWHALVSWVVEQGWWGLENLALIPGSVGAAPVQNIGAYGVEFADVCRYVDFYVWAEQRVQRISVEACQFGYRDSIFKQQLHGKGVIVAVGLQLSRSAKPVLRYPGLDVLGADATVQDIYQQVIYTRQAKLPDYKILANCGSFFKNPVISADHYQVLQQQFTAMPGFAVTDGVKVPAAWLLDQLGFKGFRQDDVGCYERQPLVLVNYGGGESAALLRLLALITERVYSAFQIQLEPEVRLLNANGQHDVKS